MTIRDVANTAGVSLQTVSNVLNGRNDQMSAGTLARVSRTIEELDYHRNPAARGLRVAKAECLGFLVLDEASRFLADPMTDLFLAGFGDALREHDLSLLIQASKPDWPMEKLVLPVQAGRVDGAVLLLSGRLERRQELMTQLRGLDAQFLLLQEHRAADHGLLSVTADDRTASRTLSRHLLEQGRAPIAYITAAHRWSAIEERVAGYREAHLEAGVPVDPRLVLWEGGFGALDAAATAHRLLESPNRPDAIMCGNDLIALGVLKAARECGIRVPDDLAVTGFDDFEFAAAIDPPLTTVTVPGYDMGRYAALLLAGADPPPPQSLSHDRFPAVVQFRGST
jgi:DNA-binding LacI/PurR family transcriptional regulator